MTITAQTSKTGPYSGNGTTTVFSYTFEVQDEAHLVVTLADAAGVETVQVLNTDYTVSGVGNANGGQITMTTAPASTYTLTISRNVPITQEVDLENRRSVAPEVLEDAYDKLTQIAQDLSEQLGRAIKISVTEGGNPTLTLEGDVQPGTFLGFDNAGNLAQLAPASGTFISPNAAIVAVDDFTGDGTTVNFTMGGIPLSPNNLFIFLDGVMQDAANYTVSGTTLTFTTAPPLNTNIEVRRLQAVAISPGATTADLVTYSPSGTGAQNTTVEAKLRDFVSVKDFGAVGDGVTDDTAAFNLAIAYANAKGGTDRGGIVGSTISIPEGRYVISSALDPVTVSSVCFVGASKASAVILSTVNGATFTFGDATQTRLVVGGGVSNVKIEYPSGPAGGAIAFSVDYGFSLVFENLMLENIGRLLSLGQSASRIAGGVIVRNVQGSIGNIGVPAFDLKYGAGLFVSDCQIFVRGVLNPTHPASMTTVLGTYVFKCDTGFWDTLQVTNCLFERFDIGIACVPPASSVYQNFFFSNTIFDYFRRWCVYAETNAAGSVASSFVFDKSCWFATWEEDAIALIGSTGFNDGHKISGVIPIAGKYGIKYQVTNAKNNSITDLVVNGCNRLGAVASCLQFQANSTGFTVNSVSGNDDATIGWTRPAFGIVVAADCDGFMVTSCRMEGPTGGYSFAVNASGSALRKAYNNINANYAGYAAKSMPASGVTYTNTTPHIEEWSFFGGTIVGGYDKNGQGFPGALQYVTFRLEPNDTFTCGYSAAPTVKVFVER